MCMHGMIKKSRAVASRRPSQPTANVSWEVSNYQRKREPRCYVVRANAELDEYGSILVY